MTTTSIASIRAAARVGRFSYAIRQVVAEAKKVEATGRTVRYLNIGDPNAFGFVTPPHLVEAVAKAMRDGHNGYTASAGIASAREAAAADFVARGVPASADRVLITSGTSEGIELALSAIVDEGEDVLVPSPTYPLYTAVLAKIGAHPVYYRTDPARGWLPDLDHLTGAVTDRTRALVLIDPNNPTGAVYPEAVRRQLVEFAESRGLVILADEVYGDLGFDGPVPALAAMAPDAAIISYSSLSKAYLAPGWRAGWMAVGATPRLDDALAAIKKLADGRLCSPGPMQYARDRRAHRRPFAPDRLPPGAARARRAHRPALQRHPGHAGRGAASGVLCDAAGDAASGKDRRGLRARAPARQGHPLRARLGIRASRRRRLLPRGVPGVAG